MRTRVILALALAAGATPVAPTSIARQSDKLGISLLRFWDLRGAPIAVIQYSLTTRDQPDLHFGPELRATFTLRSSGAGQAQGDTVWQQGFNQTDGKTREHVAAGIVAMALPAHIASWSLSSTFTGSGTRIESKDVASPSLPAGSIVVSDLAFGVPRSSDVWQFADHAALLDLTGVFERNDSVHLFFQVRSDSVHENARTWITVTNVTDPTRGLRVVQMNYPMRLDAGVNAFDRILGIANQTTGKYLVELQVGDVNGGGTSVRSGQFVVK